MVNSFQNQKKLHRKYMFQVLLAAKELLARHPSLVDVPIPESNKFTVCGDVHGQFYDLVNIWELNGRPSAEVPPSPAAHPQQKIAATRANPITHFAFLPARLHHPTASVARVLSAGLAGRHRTRTSSMATSWTVAPSRLRSS